MTERDDAPLLPDVTSDERAAGWGDDDDDGSDDLRRLTEDLPPHHIDRD